MKDRNHLQYHYLTTIRSCINIEHPIHIGSLFTTYVNLQMMTTTINDNNNNKNAHMISEKKKKKKNSEHLGEVWNAHLK